MLLEFRREISVFLLPLPLAISKVNTSEYKTIGSFVEMLKRYVDMGNSFNDSWKKSLDEFNKESGAISSKVLVDLKNFSSSFGTSDLSGELRLIDSLNDNLLQIYEEQKSNVDLSSKVKMMLPIYLGAVVCIFIL